MTETVSDDSSSDDEYIREYERKRLQELKKQFKSGDYEYNNFDSLVHDIQGDEDVLNRTTHYSKVIIHFYHPDYNTCRIIDNHFKSLSTRFSDVMICRVSVLSCPFLVAKFKIRVLPCICVFVDGTKIDQIVGFDELGGSSEFTLGELVSRINRSGILKSEFTLNK